MRRSVILLMAMLAIPAMAQTALPEVDDLPVMTELPDVMALRDGTPITSADQWPAKRAEILEAIQFYQYGHVPPAPGNVEGKVHKSEEMFEGTSTLHLVRVRMGPDHDIRARVGLYVPNDKPGPFPVVLAVDAVWNEGHHQTAQLMNERGYIYAGFERGDFDPDTPNRDNGVHQLYPESDWGSIAAWAWGMNRVTDYLVTRDDVDPKRLVVTGHSRSGKTALLAGVLDERIGLVAPRCSGCGGAGS